MNTRSRTRIRSILQQQQVKLSSSTISLGNDDNIVHNIINFVGTNEFRFISTISKQYNRIYKEQHSENQATSFNSITSISRSILCYNEIAVNKQQKMLCTFVAGNGYLNVLEYLHSTLHCSWDKWICIRAASHGHLNCLQYAHTNGCPWDARVCYVAAAHNHLHVLQYAHDNACPWDETTICAAAVPGHLNVIQYAHDHGCPWDIKTCYYAAKEGHLNILKYAHENGCPWDQLIYGIAALCGHLDIFRYAYESDCPLLEFFMLLMCPSAAKSGLSKYITICA